MAQKKQRIELEVKSNVMMTTAIVVSIAAVLGGAFFMVMGVIGKRSVEKNIERSENKIVISGRSQESTDALIEKLEKKTGKKNTSEYYRR